MALSSMSGKYFVQMDQRGRISVPSIIRTSIGDTLYISADQRSRHHLVIRSEEGFKAELERIREMCIAQNQDILEPDELLDEIEDARRDFTAFTQKTSPDNNGRITVDKDLVEYAQLGGRIIVNGVGDYAEIWNEERFNANIEEYRKGKELRRAKIDAARRARRGETASEK